MFGNFTLVELQLWFEAPFFFSFVEHFKTCVSHVLSINTFNEKPVAKRQEYSALEGQNCVAQLHPWDIEERRSVGTRPLATELRVDYEVEPETSRNLGFTYSPKLWM